ncbi:anoctamin-1-like isoform X3 [Labeo rohita]|uniref:Anoctamin n=1 Tax=Labeo rohita TaxID=84645 RepID=A0A498M7M8_LABRO|nr:anoctamin-1-like isoform X3 [Labeo rohita]
MKGEDDANTARKDEEADGSGEKLLGFNSTEEQPPGPGGQDSMWRNEKYETVPLDVKGIDEDSSKGTRDSLYPKTALRKAQQGSERPKDAKLWPYFQDGLRRIDYVLTYHVQKPQSTRKQSSKSCLCCKRNRNNPPAHVDPELAAQEQRLDYHEDDQRLRREEFEENLREMGLEMEREEGLRKAQQGSERPKDAKLWPYFQDGLRRIDYVLTYHVQKPQSTRKQSSKSCLCCKRNRNNPPAHVDPELAAQEQRLDYHEDDQRLRREEFEENLREMGLEMEREEGTKIPGVGFLKIHAPWEVLCREAEFMKLKMPTIKKYVVGQGSNIVEKVNMFMQKVTAPLQPKVGENRMENEKHLSYPFSREKQHLFDLSDRNSFFDSKTRSSIVYEILKRTKCTRAKYIMGISSLLGSGVYTEAYPVHDGDIDGVNTETNDRKILYEEWASYSIFYKYQPIGLIRKYFGEKVGLYFAWLGVYTQMLIPAAIVGVIVFLYGCATVDDNIPSMEVCDERNNITMCPMCDRACSYWKLVTACGTARASHLFDNAATVFFAIFMALWVTGFEMKNDTI